MKKSTAQYIDSASLNMIKLKEEFLDTVKKPIIVENIDRHEEYNGVLSEYTRDYLVKLTKLSENIEIEFGNLIELISNNSIGNKAPLNIYKFSTYLVSLFKTFAIDYGVSKFDDGSSLAYFALPTVNANSQFIKPENKDDMEWQHSTAIEFRSVIVKYSTKGITSIKFKPLPVMVSIHAMKRYLLRSGQTPSIKTLERGILEMIRSNLVKLNNEYHLVGSPNDNTVIMGNPPLAGLDELDIGGSGGIMVSAKNTSINHNHNVCVNFKRGKVDVVETPKIGLSLTVKTFIGADTLSGRRLDIYNRDLEEVKTNMRSFLLESVWRDYIKI